MAGKTQFLLSLLVFNPIWPWSVRTYILRVLGVRIGSRSVLGHRCEISGHLGNLIIHDDVYINSYAYMQISALVTIHDGARIGPYFRLLTTLHPTKNAVIRRQWGGDVYLPSSIGRGCWLGIGVTVLPGVSIAEGCIVAAGSIVTTSTTANGLYAGTPARRIKDLAID